MTEIAVSFSSLTRYPASHLYQQVFNTGGSVRAAVIAVCLLFLANLAYPTRTTALGWNEMSDESAARLLNAHSMFADTQTVTLHTGTIHAKQSDVEHYRPIYSRFRSMGLIKIASVKIESGDEERSKTIDGTRVSLTEKGLEESKSWKQVNENAWTITVAERKLVEVIKIHKDEKTVHGIEFLWTWDPNKTGQALELSYATERAYARLEPEDGGWRIVTIRAVVSIQ